MGYWGCGMLGMWDVRDVGWSACGLFGIWDVGDMGCSGCEMLGMWDVRDVGCSGFGMFEMWDVGCRVFTGMWDVDASATSMSSIFNLTFLKFDGQNKIFHEILYHRY